MAKVIDVVVLLPKIYGLVGKSEKTHPEVCEFSEFTRIILLLVLQEAREGVTRLLTAAPESMPVGLHRRVGGENGVEALP